MCLNATMNPLLLDPGEYGGSYKLIGGEVCLDFVNTISWPGTNREHDWLDRSGNVTAWAEAAGLITKSTRAVLDAEGESKKGRSEKDLESVHDIRNDLRDVLTPLASGKIPATSAVIKLDNMVHDVFRARRLEGAEWVWEVPQSLVAILNPVIWNAAHVLTDVNHKRLGKCPACDWLFYDATKNRSRRWCDMKDCGSRSKANRYYRRSRQQKV